METCSICLDALDGGVAALACGHRFHAACLASMAGAVGTAATTSRRGTLTACPNCRITSRVAPVTSAAHGVGDKVLALWGYKWYPGVVDEVLDGGRAYKIAWDDGVDGEAPAAHVRAEQLTVDAPAARDASPPAVVTPRASTPDEPLSPARPPPPSQEELLAQVEKLRAENSQLKRHKLDEASTCNGVVELIKRYDRDGHATIDELNAGLAGIISRRKKLRRESRIRDDWEAEVVALQAQVHADEPRYKRLRTIKRKIEADLARAEQRLAAVEVAFLDAVA